MLNSVLSRLSPFPCSRLIFPPLSRSTYFADALWICSCPECVYFFLKPTKISQWMLLVILQWLKRLRMCQFNSYPPLTLLTKHRAKKKTDLFKCPSSRSFILFYCSLMYCMTEFVWMYLISVLHISFGIFVVSNANSDYHIGYTEHKSNFNKSQHP